MKIATFLLVFLMLVIPFQSAEAKKPESSQVVLTARDVDGAEDIEAAISRATGKGSRSGTVILDGKNGPFVFTSPDKSLNIFVSNLTLRGENDAWITQCDDGLFFEGNVIEDILVEKVSFSCTGDGVEAMGAFKDVTLRKNTFMADKTGINIKGESYHWVITENVIKAGSDAVRVKDADNIIISKNDLTGKNGVVLLTSSKSEVKSNKIQASSQGIILGQEASKNIIQANNITGVSLSGIALEPNVTNNRILSNKVTCASGSTCMAVDTPKTLGSSNKISGNSRK